MIIHFDNKKTEELCSCERLQIKKLGVQGSKILQSRISDLLAAKCMTDMPSLFCWLEANGESTLYTIRILNGYELFLTPKDDPPPYAEDGSIDWNQVFDVFISCVKIRY